MKNKSKVVNLKEPRKVTVTLPSDIVLKIKTQAFNSGQTMTRYLSDLIVNTMKG